jgi:hypothetical protein
MRYVYYTQIRVERQGIWDKWQIPLFPTKKKTL